MYILMFEMSPPPPFFLISNSFAPPLTANPGSALGCYSLTHRYRLMGHSPSLVQKRGLSYRCQTFPALAMYCYIHLGEQTMGKVFGEMLMYITYNAIQLKRYMRTPANVMAMIKMKYHFQQLFPLRKPFLHAWRQWGRHVLQLQRGPCSFRIVLLWVLLLHRIWDEADRSAVQLAREGPPGLDHAQWPLDISQSIPLSIHNWHPIHCP